VIEGILGRKLGMLQIFDNDGNVVPVTAIEAGPCQVTQVKTEDRDGYSSIQIGFGSVKRVNSPMRGHLRRQGPFRYLREFKADDAGSYNVGDRVGVDIFEPGERVDVVGTSKGRGFAGVVKRHGFHGGPKTHGQSDRHRSPGSIGATTTPGRVVKGLKMAGHMGHERVTALNLEVIEVNAARGILMVKGSVPGPVGGLVRVRHAVKAVKAKA
jgi:large subunit ribosomal protein L3